MIYFVSIVHALTCIFIVLFILLQDPKGGVLGSLGGGGGGKSLLGSDASPFLVNVTKWLAIIFACSSFYLSYMSSKTISVMEKAGIEQNFPQPAGPAEQKENGATKNENSKR
ncbi:MAG: preprotein translocase subunit SecG [Oligoflexia bacterium]|nr:preprotein translocase subunit SecG [Oligoflexia bacterium]